MLRALYTSSTGMYGQQLNIDAIAHNVSNVNTVGFKKSRVNFQDLLYQTIQKPVASEEIQQPTGLQIGLGTRPAAIQTLFTQGSLSSTGNPLDVAIRGDAFFKVEVPGYDEPLYTRNGAFLIDAEGNLVNSDGYYVIGPDSIDPGARDISVGTDGTITYKAPGDDEVIEAGRLELSRFINPNGLELLGKSLYQATELSGEPEDWDPEDDNSVSLHGSYLEMSNVQIVEEMVNLITAQRAYEFNSKSIQSADEMLGMAANLKR
jgi:flagellar basal-body rod protein FlgG